MGRRAISNTFCVNTIEDGQRGKVGRFYYYAGEFNKNNTTTRFKVTDAQAPFFHHLESGQDRYHVYNPEKNPTTVNSDLSMFDMWKESGNGNWNNGSWNNAPWVAMTNDFKFLITEALFSEFAHLGGAIINGTWMLSQHGTINGSASSDYEEFSALHPNEDVGNNFVPNYCVDLLTGSTYQHDAYLSGSLYAQSIQLKFFDVEADEDGLFYVGLQGEQGIWNFRITEDVKIVLPTNQYSNYGQRVTIYNPILGLGGTGDETIIVASQVASDGQGGWIYAGNAGGGLTLNFDDIRGVALPYGSSGGELTPVAINSYTPVRRIVFNNGIVELMCVPTSIQGQTCEWCVINLGTNVLRLYPTAS